MLALKNTFKWMAYILVILLILMTLVVFAVTFYIFPNIDDYKDDIAHKISTKIGQKVSIGNIETDWEGISPKMIIQSMDVYDQQNQSALHLEDIHGTFSWLSIPLLHLQLSELAVDQPTLHIRRDESGKLYIAGIPITGNGKPVLANWLLKQARVDVKNASIVWQDAYRQAPSLSLNQFNFTLSNPAWRKIFGQHQFHLSAIPSIGTNKLISVQGNFYGRDFDQFAKWRGNIKLKANDVDLAIWKQWVDYPIDITNGTGNTELTFGFAQNQINQLIADVQLKSLSANIVENKPPLEASNLSGLMTWEQNQDKTTVTAQKLNLTDQGKKYLSNGSGVIYQTALNNQNWVKASLSANAIDLAILDKINASLTLPEQVNQQLTALAPTGELKQIKASFEGNRSNLAHYKIKGLFDHINIQASGNLPGLSNFSGEIDADEEDGLLTLNTSGAKVAAPNVLRWPIPLNTLSGKVKWQLDEQKLKVITNDIQLANQHLSGTVDVNYQLLDGQNSYLDLTGKFDHGDAQHAPFYYPNILNKNVTGWLDKSILSGKLSDINVRIKGNLKDFPFVDKQNQPDPALGIFKVTARLDDAQLKYGDSWPQIDQLGLDMRFEGNSMELVADQGHLMGVSIEQCIATIPTLKTTNPGNQKLLIKSQGSMPVAEGIKFINASPVKQVTLGFTDDLETAGTGKLKLDLNIPLKDINSTTFSGNVDIQNGTIYANPRMGIPEINQIVGVLSFNESALTAKAINAQILDGPAVLNIASKADKTIEINANGTAQHTGLQSAFPSTVTDALSGSAQWSADIIIKKPLLQLDITSSLQGMAINLPAPFNKVADESSRLSIAKKQALPSEDTFEIEYGQLITAKILRQEKQGELTIDRGSIAINQPLKLQDTSGIHVSGKFNQIKADEWIDLLGKQERQDSQTALISSIDLVFGNLDIFNRNLSALSVHATPHADSIDMVVSSDELAGNIEWRSPSKDETNGKIIAQLNKLHIPASNNAPEQEENTPSNADKQQYPALDLKADDFKLGNKALGSLAIKAYENNNNWVIQQLQISNADSVLNADGIWQNWSGNPSTKLNFSLSVNNIGNTLKRFGQPDTVKGGVALIVGNLAWPGSPHQFKKTGLSGQFTLGASKGQVLKVQPGVGRLFGLLTLQSLPRRLTLDFRDLFSEGFAFDEISATAALNNGIMRSDDFYMTGPAAETDIKGEVDLTNETQNLHVRVEPHVSDTLSLAALAGGPIAGVAAFVAQKILKDPLNKIAQSEYIIVGTWDNPIEKDAPKQKQEQEISPLNAQQN